MFGLKIERDSGGRHAGGEYWLWARQASGPSNASTHKLRKAWPQSGDPMARFCQGGQFGLRIVEGWNGQGRVHLVEQVRYAPRRLRREREKPRLHRVLRYWDAD